MAPDDWVVVSTMMDQEVLDSESEAFEKRLNEFGAGLEITDCFESAPVKSW